MLIIFNVFNKLRLILSPFLILFLSIKNCIFPKFIFPPFRFQICSGMVTNFHSPKSTLLMMAAAYGGFDNIMKAYKIAIQKKYRFHSYFDAMLIL